jgi:Rhodopirellula transposase DDE domain
MDGMESSTVQAITAKYTSLEPVLDERARRLWAAVEARAIGRGGITRVSEATGLSRVTIRAGLNELDPPSTPTGREPATGRLRRPGGGRKCLVDQDPILLRDLETLVDPVTRGDPMSPLRWTCKSAAKLAAELGAKGHAVSERTVNRLLHVLDYSLQSNRKTIEGKGHPDRDAQFQYINRRVQAFQRRGQPVVSVDAKKKELVGQFRNGGREWQPKGQPEEVEVYDFAKKDQGKVIPYGIYDQTINTGWVSVGVDHDTAEFAVETLRRWWRNMGSQVDPRARRLLITADGGGSNGRRCRLWKVELQGLADEIGLRISVCHFPPGTSKWNKIEHRMFCHITENWRGRPLVSREVVVNLIGYTTTKTGLSIRSELDEGSDPTGRKVSDEQMKGLVIRRDKFHGEWNYTILPRR